MPPQNKIKIKIEKLQVRGLFVLLLVLQVERNKIIVHRRPFKWGGRCSMQIACKWSLWHWVHNETKTIREQ